MIEDFSAQDFFTAGGTLLPDSPSYVKRPADDQLFQQAMDGQFCYVLSARQMGKSSLMIRAAARLQRAKVRTAIIDLTQIGTVKSPDQWYAGILTQIRKRLQLSVNPVEWWEQCGDLPLTQKFTDFMREVVLAEVKERVVIFIDEIDTMLKLDFRDDFFAGIRAIYNGRAEDQQFCRLTFVLLGVASPVDLIEDRRRTPFNIGVEIPLRYFSREDARLLESGLEQAYPGCGAQILDRIYSWTSGHPYLTQKLAQVIVEKHDREWNQENIDKLVSRMFLSGEAHRETNLQFVRENILDHPQKQQMLALYAKIYRGKIIKENKSSIIHNRLKLSGLVVMEDDHFVIGNEIYRQVFNLAWAQKNMQVNWARIVAAAATAAAVLAIGVLLGIIYYNNGVPQRIQEAENCDYSPMTPEIRFSCLADLVNIHPIFSPTDYDYKAREVFFSLNSWEEQKSIFEVSNPNPEDLVKITRIIYTTLADVSGTGENKRLLQVMDNALTNAQQTQAVAYLNKEIRLWISGLEKAQAGYLEEAVSDYSIAIQTNTGNPSTYYERGMLYLKLGQPEKTLEDFNELLSQAAEESNSYDKGNATDLETPLVLTSTTTAAPTEAVTVPAEGSSGAGGDANTGSGAATPSGGEVTTLPVERTPSPSPEPGTPGVGGIVGPGDNMPIQSRFSTLSDRVNVVRREILTSALLTNAYREILTSPVPVSANQGPQDDPYGYLRLKVSIPTQAPISADAFAIINPSLEGPSNACELGAGQTIQLQLTGSIPVDAAISWEATAGTFEPSNADKTQYTAPDQPGAVTIKVRITPGKNAVQAVEKTIICTVTKASIQTSLDQIAVGDSAPQFTTTTFEGQPVNLADYAGKVIVLNFWASWSLPCQQEALALEKAYQHYKPGGEVVFLGLAYVDTQPNALTYLKEFGITYPTAPDLSTKVSQAFHIRGVPETYIIDKRGRLAYVKTGPFTSEEEIIRAVDAVLEPSSIASATPSQPTRTPTPACPPALEVFQTANCREGPGTGWKVVTGFRVGTTLAPRGYATWEKQNWWNVTIPGTNRSCWILGSTVNVVGEASCLTPFRIPPTYTPVFVPAAPALISPADGTSFTCAWGAGQYSVRFQWSPVSGAQGYALMLYQDNTAYFQAPLSSDTSISLNISCPSSVGPKFGWSVHAVDAAGNVWPESETWSFQVFGGIPPTAAP